MEGVDVHTPVGLTSARGHFERMLPAIEGLLEAEMRHVGFDVPLAVSLVLGSLTRLRQMQEVFDGLPGLNGRLLDELESAAMAAWYAHLMYVQEPEGRVLEAMAAEAIELRATLRIAAEILAVKGELPLGELAGLGVGSDSLAIARDLTQLATVFQRNAQRLAGRTAVTATEIERAASLGPELMMALSMSHLEDALSASARRLRERACTLLELQWEQVRLAVGFLRWHEGDVDELVPSLRVSRARRRPTRSGLLLMPELQAAEEASQEACLLRRR